MSEQRWRTAVQGAAAAALLVATTQAAPSLRIVNGPALGVPNPANTEQTGDPGGSVYPWLGQPGPGAGIPWNGLTAGGWPAGPGMVPDISFLPNNGTSGYHSSYLYLTEPATVLFQFVGGGTSILLNEFYVNGQLLFSSEFTQPSPVTPAGATFPVPHITAGGYPLQNEYAFNLNAGLINFQFKTGNGVILDNTGAGNGNPDPHTQGGLPGYFLGADPYLAQGPYETVGSAMYAGLSDLPALLDHDFQDLGVRIVAVPESGTVVAGILLLGGCAATWRRARHSKASTGL